MKNYQTIEEYRAAYYPLKTEEACKKSAQKAEEEASGQSGSRFNVETRKRIREEIRSVLA